jgi:hypothetical protein
VLPGYGSLGHFFLEKLINVASKKGVSWLSKFGSVGGNNQIATTGLLGAFGQASGHHKSPRGKWCLC